MDVFLVFLGFIVLFVGLIVWGARVEKQRQEVLAAAAARLGLSYSPEHDWSLARKYESVNALRQGDNRYALDVMRGTYREQKVLVFSYHYETETTGSKGNRSTQSHYLNIYTLAVPRSFPELIILKEGFFSKMVQAFGYDDIDFESYEFSKTFCVRSKDKKFAYAICHPLTMEYLLANQDLNIEIEGNHLIYVFQGKVKPGELEGNLLRLIQFKELIPSYLWQS
jgi:hypothetical protein